MLILSGLKNKTQRHFDRRKPKKTELKTEGLSPVNHAVSTLVFAHRGSKCNRPENTLASFREAVRVGADGIELDVHLSADNELMVIHDEKIDRTTDGKGLVRNLARKELQTYDAGTWFSYDYRAEHIPTLIEVLQLLTELDFTGVLNIEIKTDKYHYPDIEGKLSALMTSKKWAFSYLYSSFNIKSLKTLAQLEPDTEISYLTYNRRRKIKQGLLEDFIDSMHPRKSYAFRNPNRVMTSIKPLRVWTVNRETEMLEAFDNNIAGLITDFPEKAIQLKKQLIKKTRQ